MSFSPRRKRCVVADEHVGRPEDGLGPRQPVIEVPWDFDFLSRPVPVYVEARTVEIDGKLVRVAVKGASEVEQPGDAPEHA